MLPNIDPTTNAVNTGASAPAAPQQQVKSPGQSAQDKAAEAAYNALPGIRAPQPETQRTRDDSVQPGAGEARRAGATSQSGRLQAAKPKTGSHPQQQGDQAEINFQLTKEERDAFLNAMSGQENPSDMTEREQTALQRASERVQKLMDDAAARTTDRTDRLDKAIREWYSRLSNGKYSAPPNLLQLIQQAAAGNMNFKNIGESVA